MLKFKRNIQLNGHISLLSKLHSKETLNIYTVELPASHWDQALRRQWSSKLLLVTIMIGQAEGIRMSLPGASLTILQSSSAKLKRSAKQGEEKTGEGFTFVV